MCQWLTASPGPSPPPRVNSDQNLSGQASPRTHPLPGLSGLWELVSSPGGSKAESNQEGDTEASALRGTEWILVQRCS